jgi:predicted nucleic acid-binding protein
VCVRFLESQVRLCISAQVAREYLVVATRPVEVNGLGLAAADALANLREFRKALRLLPEERPVLPALLSLLDEVPCRGRRIHDAHLVATAIVHRLRNIVTLNGEDFAPFSAHVSTMGPARIGRRPRAS